MPHFSFDLANALTAFVVLLSCSYLIGSVYSAYSFAIRPTPIDRSHPVTILKPLCGDDHELEINLRSFCRQNYGVYQIVFGIQNPDDPAIAVVRKIIAEFAHIDIALVVNSDRLSRNMKVANLQNMLSAAKYDYLVMADSDIRVQPDYVSAIVEPLRDPAIGAVTCLYRGISQGSFWSDFGCLHINYGFLPQAILGNKLDIGNGCFGASIAMRRHTLEELGGFSAMGNVLADDHELGLAIKRLGKKVLLSRHIVNTTIGENDIKTLFSHESRWASTICRVHKLGYIGSVLTFPVALTLIGACSRSLPHGAYILSAVILLRMCTAATIGKILGLPAGFFFLLPFRDVLSFFVFINGFFSRTVSWRATTIRITRTGHIILDGDLPA